MTRTCRTAITALALVLVATACGASSGDDLTAVPGATPTTTDAPTTAEVDEPDTGEEGEVSEEAESLIPSDVVGTPIDGGVPSWLTPHLADGPVCPSADEGTASTCYRLTVAADRDDPSGGVVVLPIRVVSPVGVDVPSDAVVSPAGGPGFSGMFRATGLAGDLGRDVVAFDQRGTGGAIPSLECEAADDAFLANLQAAGGYEEEREAIVAATEGCVAGAEASGIDLTDYNSIENVHDLEDIRVALGYEQWNLVGVSYGGRFALTSMREHPGSVRSVILDSVYDVSYGGPSSTAAAIDRAFEALIEACAASTPCAARGDLGEMLDRVTERYNDTPIESTVEIDDAAVDFVITGDDLIGGLFEAMYDTALLPLLPSIVASLDDGETAIIADFIASSVPFATDAANLMANSTDCSDNVGLGRRDADLAFVADPGRLSTVAKSQVVCPADWTPTAPDFNEPIVSELPALIYAGGMDPITPPEPTLALADNLPNSTSVLVPFGGHGVWLVDECAGSISLAFIDDPTAPLDTSCADAFGPLAPS